MPFHSSASLKSELFHECVPVVEAELSNGTVIPVDRTANMNIAVENELKLNTESYVRTNEGIKLKKWPHGGSSQSVA